MKQVVRPWGAGEAAPDTPKVSIPPFGAYPQKYPHAVVDDGWVGNGVEQGCAWMARRVGQCFGANRLDVPGSPWTPTDTYGRMVEAAGVETVDSQPCKTLQERDFWC